MRVHIDRQKIETETSAYQYMLIWRNEFIDGSFILFFRVECILHINYRLSKTICSIQFFSINYVQKCKHSQVVQLTYVGFSVHFFLMPNASLIALNVTTIESLKNSYLVTLVLHCL